MALRRGCRIATYWSFEDVAMGELETVKGWLEAVTAAGDPIEEMGE